MSAASPDIGFPVERERRVRGMDRTSMISQVPAGAFEAAALAVAGLAAAWVAARVARARPVRLASGFLLPIFLLVPPPAGALLFTAAALTGLGPGVVGPAGAGRGSLLGVAAAGAVAQTVAMALPSDLLLAPWSRVAALAALYAIAEATAWGLAALLGFFGGNTGSWRGAFRPGRLLPEAGNIAIAWLLDTTIRAGRHGDVMIVGGTVLAAAIWSARSADARRAARHAGLSLANRSAELAVLQSLAREILTSVDPDRLHRIVERECRKIFRCDFFLLATVERETGDIRAVYRSDSEDEARSTTLPPGDGLVAWVVRERAHLRIDDFRDPAVRFPFRPRIADPAIRSAIAVPLVAHDRTVGVLSVQSRIPETYDEEHLQLLETIGHQAAVAIENARHYELATTDSLTGLLARETFFSRLEDEYQRALRYHLSFAVLMLDIDRFKELNDRHGHPAGDRYLRAFGEAVRRSLRAADLASRYGGDEFCLLLPETDMEAAHQIAERLRANLASLNTESGTSVLRSTVSIGIAAYPDHDGGDIRTLLLRADQALYRAKREGRDRVVPFAA